MADLTVIDLRAAAYQRIMASPEKYVDSIMRLFGYSLMIGLPEADDFGLLPSHWLEKFPDIAALSAAEQEHITDGVTALLYQYGMRDSIAKAIEHWHDDGAPI